MRKFHIAGVVLVALLVICVIDAASASALTSQWLEDGNPITAAKAATYTGTDITLQDAKLGATILCNVTGSGTVGPTTKDSVTSVTLTSCSVDTQCSSLDSVTVVNLPWTTEVVLVGLVYMDKLTGAGAGSPGYLIECVAGGILLDDTCTKAESFQTLENSGTGVNATFSEEKAKCSLGGEEGLVHGVSKFTLTNGLTLTVGEA